MLRTAEEIIKDTKETYGQMVHGNSYGYQAPETYELSRQVKALATVMRDELEAMEDRFDAALERMRDQLADIGGE